MKTSPFEIEIIEADDGCALKISGDFRSGIFLGKVHVVIRQLMTAMPVDLSEVVFMDSDTMKLVKQFAPNAKFKAESKVREMYLIWLGL